MHFVLILLIVTFSGICNASELNIHSSSNTKINLVPHVDIYTDTNKTLTFEQLLKDEDTLKQTINWSKATQKGSSENINFSFTPNSYWLRVSLTNRAAQSDTWILELNRAGLDYVDFFQVTNQNLIKQVRTGDRRPASSRDVFHQNFAFSVHLKPNQTNHIYIKLDSYDGLIESTAITLLSPLQFGQTTATAHLWFGLFIGLMLAMILYNLFLFISIGDKPYLFYCFYIASLLFYSINYFGYSSIYLLPDSPDLNNTIRLIATYFGIVTVIFFTLSYLNIYTSRICYVLGFLLLLASINLGLALTGYFSLTTKLNIIVVICTVFSCYIAGIRALMQGYTPASYFLVAWTIFFASLIVFSLKRLNLIPPYGIIDMSIQLGASVEVLLLSFGLAARIRKLKKEKNYAQKMALEASHKANKLKDSFLANTSHELRTPLNGIIGLAESLLDGSKGQLNSDIQQDLSMIVTSGRRLSNLVNDILDFSKLKEHNLNLQKVAIDLHTIANVVIILAKPLLNKTNDKSIKLINQIPTDLPPAQGDENRLQQILLNLFGNAIKFTHQGTVTISAAVVDEKLQISVTDTGIGISEHNQKTIFNSFEQIDNPSNLNHSGTGIGLSITKRLVNLHGGDIWVQSSVNQGATFIFSLPISTEKVTHQLDCAQTLNKLYQLEEHAQQTRHTTESTDSTEPNESTFRILVVEDKPINRRVLTNHLSLEHYQLTEASDGKQALDLINRKNDFDLILLDIMMPKVSGYDVCSQLRESYSANDLPIIFLTAKNQISDMVQSFNAGANDYLTKPINKQELVTRVKTHLKFLDIHRNLEDKVHQRTEKLENINHQIKSTQQQLIHSEKMASLGTLSAGVAHEINNPTNFVFVSSQNLSLDLANCQQFILDLAGENSEQEIIDAIKHRFQPAFTHLETIMEGATRIKQIVRDLSTFTQLDADLQKVVNMRELLQSTLNLIKTQYIETADFNTQFNSVPDIHCFPAQLNQVFMNLLVNACHAVKQRHKQQKGQIDIKLNADDDKIMIEIGDNGAGMSEDVQQRIFEPFYTTKEVGEGTGLGLSISWGIINNHQGSLTVDSTINQGTIMTVTLPIGKYHNA